MLFPKRFWPRPNEIPSVAIARSCPLCNRAVILVWYWKEKWHKWYWQPIEPTSWNGEAVYIRSKHRSHWRDGQCFFGKPKIIMVSVKGEENDTS